MRSWLMALALFIGLPAHATVIMNWEHRPIPVDLEVGTERIVQFEDHVFVGVPKSLDGHLRVQTMQGRVYFQSYSPFDPIRVQVRMAGSGEIVLLDVSSVSNEIPQPDLAESILVNHMGSKRQNLSSETDTQSQAEERQRISAVEMMRFASQTYYAPPRLQRAESRLSRIRVPGDNELPQLFRGRSFGVYKAELSAVWSTVDGRFLSAVKLTNRTPFVQPILFGDLNADFTYATPQHTDLKPAGTPGDVTMLWIIGPRPIHQALYL